ncbi:GntR family transcriptional regulator [Nonomuraea glycinis]|uniref:GntR family transcriptional regulator n=1 Tax=Nonomuraea glycinis TaxID=2047744 RepID=A0A918A8D8_9ACTN|nr:GntR family transcriptional regulator [Nonomuraea glycinis]MCA2176251.1 GntR family transcriptional regulator [Nonomuraea glycinis]GGP07546.1 GntR family transcriptional regulator [Nonomuraea glycinis]
MASTEKEPAGALSGIRVGRVAAPLREQVLDGLRRAILDFDLKPGARLVERELMEQIGVSRTTIREVLRELAAEGLVVVIPQKGAVVHAPSPVEAQDLYAVRAALESLAVRRFIERASAADVDALRATVDEMEAVALGEGDIPALLRAKDRFYDVLLEGAASPTIQDILGGVQARVRLLRATSLSQPGRPVRVISEMRALVAAIAARDAGEATRLCVAHLDNASSTGLKALAADSAAS